MTSPYPPPRSSGAKRRSAPHFAQGRTAGLTPFGLLQYHYWNQTDDRRRLRAYNRVDLATAGGGTDQHFHGPVRGILAYCREEMNYRQRHDGSEGRQGRFHSTCRRAASTASERGPKRRRSVD